MYPLASWMLCGALLVGWPVSAQEQTPVSDFFDTVEINVVNVEVFVTDEKGQPVTGLTREDFVLLDEGKPVEIGYFYAAEDGRTTVGDVTAERAAVDHGALRPDELATLPEPAGTAETTPTAGSEPPEEQLTVVLFVDSAQIQQRNLNRVIGLMRDSTWFEDGNRDRVMVVSHRGGGAVDVVQNLTADASELRAALDRLAEIPTRGEQEVMEYSNLARGTIEFTREIAKLPGKSLVEVGNEADIAILWDQLRNYAATRVNHVKATVQTLESFVDSLAGLPGRKSLVYVSDGLPLRPAEALIELFSRTGGGGGAARIDSEFDTTEYFRSLSDTANGHRVTFYTMLAGGKESYSIPQVALQRPVPSDQGGQVQLANWDIRVEAMAQSNLRAPAEMIAEATGGRAFTEPKRFDEAILEMRRDATHYYSLGYTLPFREAGREHKIEVRLKSGDWKVRHRRSYHEKSSQERMAEHTLSALMFGEGENGLGVLLELGEEKPRGKGGEVLVPLVIKLPISRLLLLPGETHHSAQLSIFVGTRDPEGRLSPVQQVPAPLRIPNDRLLTALGQVAAFQVGLVMRPGEHTVVVGVRDELADVQAVTRASHRAGSTTVVAGATAGR